MFPQSQMEVTSARVELFIQYLKLKTIDPPVRPVFYLNHNL